MVLDSAGTTAFVLTASGLSVIPLADFYHHERPPGPGERSGEHRQLHWARWLPAA